MKTKAELKKIIQDGFKIANIEKLEDHIIYIDIRGISI